MSLTLLRLSCVVAALGCILFFLFMQPPSEPEATGIYEVEETPLPGGALVSWKTSAPAVCMLEVQDPFSREFEGRASADGKQHVVVIKGLERQEKLRYRVYVQGEGSSGEDTSAMMRTLTTGKRSLSGFHASLKDERLKLSFILPAFFTRGEWSVRISVPREKEASFRNPLAAVDSNVSFHTENEDELRQILAPVEFRISFPRSIIRKEQVYLVCNFSDGTDLSFSLASIVSAEMEDILANISQIDFQKMWAQVEREAGGISANLAVRTDTFNKDDKASYDRFSRELNNKKSRLFRGKFENSRAPLLYKRVLIIAPLAFGLSSVSLEAKENFYEGVIQLLEPSAFSVHDGQNDFIHMESLPWLGAFSLCGKRNAPTGTVGDSEEFSMDIDAVMQASDMRSEILIYQAEGGRTPGIGTPHFSFVKDKPDTQKTWEFTLKSEEIQGKVATIHLATGFIRGFMVEMSVNGHKPLKIYGYPLIEEHKKGVINNLYQRIPPAYLKSGKNEVTIRPCHLFSDLTERKVFVHSLILHLDEAGER